MNWTNSSSANLTFDVGCNTSTDVYELTCPDPLVDWLPNSCLYTKYVPTWHLVRSYSK